MIKVLMLDKGDTLVDSKSNHAFNGVKDALKAIAKLKTGSGDLLQSCIVSDYDLPDPPTKDNIERSFKQYLKELDQAHLTPFFQPVIRRVTLSSHAGVYKPDRKIFELAVQRLCACAKLEECLFITEEKSHIDAAKTNLKMATLQYGVDFDDWSKAPDLIQKLL